MSPATAVMLDERLLPLLAICTLNTLRMSATVGITVTQCATDGGRIEPVFVPCIWVSGQNGLR